jgi:hypothetical protein
MPAFNFPYHLFSTKYPESSTRIQLGNGYTYTAPTAAPDQRIFTLTFPALQWFTNPDGTLDTDTSPEINLGALDAFYRDVKTVSTFTYQHPAYGGVPVRFNKPLEIPKGEPGANGVVLNVEIELIEVPGIADTPEWAMDEVEYVPLP